MDRIDDPGFALAIGDSDGDTDDLAARFVQRPEVDRQRIRLRHEAFDLLLPTMSSRECRRLR